MDRGAEGGGGVRNKKIHRLFSRASSIERDSVYIVQWGHKIWSWTWKFILKVKTNLIMPRIKREKKISTLSSSRKTWLLDDRGNESIVLFYQNTRRNEKDSACNGVSDHVGKTCLFESIGQGRGFQINQFSRRKKSFFKKEHDQALQWYYRGGGGGRQSEGGITY